MCYNHSVWPGSNKATILGTGQIIKYRIRIKCRIVLCFDGDDQTKFVFHHCDAVTTHHRCCDENIIENCFSPPPHSKFRAQLLHFWKRRKQIRRKLKANVKSRKMELFEASET